MSAAANWKPARELLFSWHASGEGDPSLTAAVLQGWAGSGKAASDVTDLLKRDELRECGLKLLAECVHKCPETVLSELSQQWTDSITGVLNSVSDVSVLRSVCHATTSLVTRLHDCSPGLVRHFTSQQLPSLLPPLICFSQGREELQCIVLPTISSVLTLFPSSTSRYRGALRSWAERGIFDSSVQVAQECSRLLVLLSRDAPNHWAMVVSSLLTALQHHLALILSPVLGTPEPCTSSMPFPFSLPPVKEPQRTATLLRQLLRLGLVLRTALAFPPPSATVQFPLHLFLSVVFLGLSVYPQDVTGHSSDALLLLGVLPAIHSAMWTLLTAVIQSSHLHILPYVTAIESVFVQAMTTYSFHHWPLALLDLHKALRAWWDVRGDCDEWACASIVRALLEGFKGRSTVQEDAAPMTKKRKTDGKGEKEVGEVQTEGDFSLRLSSVVTLTSLVERVGPLLPAHTAQLIGQLPLGVLNSSEPSPLLEALLKLMVACVHSGSPHLSPSLSAAVQIFSQASMTSCQKVVEVCREGLACCSALQHPHQLPTIIQPPDTITWAGTQCDVSHPPEQGNGELTSDLSPPERTVARGVVSTTEATGGGQRLQNPSLKVLLTTSTDTGDGDMPVDAPEPTPKKMNVVSDLSRSATTEEAPPLRTKQDAETTECGDAVRVVVEEGEGEGEGVAGGGVAGEEGVGVIEEAVDQSEEGDARASGEEDSDTELLQMFVDAPANTSDSDVDVLSL